MHCHAEIWLSELEDVEKQISEILAPYDENLNPDGFWDWWQIGGRWTGVHTDYDPYEDERNVRICRICNGTGFRDDYIGLKRRLETGSYTCNGCGVWNDEAQAWGHSKWGPGREVVWPTDFAPYPGDLIPLSDVKDDLTCYTLIVKGRVFHEEIWTGESFQKTDFGGNVLKQLHAMGIRDGYLVTVDYHS